jgi:hypothetical protein
VTGTQPGRKAGQADITVSPAGGTSPGALPAAGKLTRWFSARNGGTGITLSSGHPLHVRLPERHPAEDAPAGTKLFGTWAAPRAEDAHVAARTRRRDQGMRLTPELRAELAGLIGEASTIPEFLAASAAYFDRMAREWATGTEAGRDRPAPGGREDSRVLENEASQVRDDTAAARRDPQLRGNPALLQLQGAAGGAERLAAADRRGRLNAPSGGWAAARRVWSGVCEVAGTLAFAAARHLKPGRARDAAERLGNRATGFIARERNWLDHSRRLEPGSYSLPEGWKGAPSRRADVAARLDDISRETGNSTRLRDLTFDGAEFTAAFTKVPKSRRSRVQPRLIRNAVPGPDQPHGKKPA